MSLEDSSHLSTVSMNAEWCVAAPELAESLSASFEAGPVVDSRGNQLLTEKQVARIDGLKVEIFADEHPPPHFRVIYGGETANFQIADCARINGGLDKWLRTIRKWHRTNKSKLIEVWNTTRPADCPVGPYQEPDAMKT